MVTSLQLFNKENSIDIVLTFWMRYNHSVIAVLSCKFLSNFKTLPNRKKKCELWNYDVVHLHLLAWSELAEYVKRDSIKCWNKLYMLHMYRPHISETSREFLDVSLSWNWASHTRFGLFVVLVASSHVVAHYWNIWEDRYAHTRNSWSFMWGKCSLHQNLFDKCVSIFPFTH